MSTAQDRRVGKTRTGTPFDQAMARPAKPKPSSTIEQKMTALGRAKEIRLARADCATASPPGKCSPPRSCLTCPMRPGRGR